MSRYFGFVPSDKLKSLIDEADQIVASGADVEYYKYRDALTHQTARDLIDTLLVGLVDIIPHAERQERMRKIIAKIEGASETLLNILLNKGTNAEVMESFNFLKDKAMFVDNDGVNRVGYKLAETEADTIQAGFDATQPDSTNMAKLKESLSTINESTLDHFVVGFADTLKLGMIKRKSVPVAKGVIDKGMSMALNKLMPDLPDDSLNRLADYYRPFIVEKQDS